jgi:hypothetical protein
MNWKKLHFYLHTFFRYFLATIILSYAFAKILGTQFTTQPSIYDQPVGSLSGFNLTWYYYGYSFWYGVFIAISQIASSIILFFIKTTRVGVVLFLSFMVNILLVDYAYDIQGAKVMATIMTLMALFIFLSEYTLFIKYFLKEPPLFQKSERPNWVTKITMAKWVYIPLVFIGIFFGLSAIKAKFMGKNKFYGTWYNTDSTASFKNFNFEVANTFKINGTNNLDQIANGQYSFTNDIITLKTFTKEYHKFLENDKTNAILKPDTTKMITLIKGRYKLNEKQLTIENDTNKIVLKRIR